MLQLTLGLFRRRSPLRPSAPSDFASLSGFQFRERRDRLEKHQKPSVIRRRAFDRDDLQIEVSGMTVELDDQAFLADRAVMPLRLVEGRAQWIEQPFARQPEQVAR